MFHILEKNLVKLILPLVSAAVVSTVAEAQLIDNGDFEQPLVPDGEWYRTVNGGNEKTLTGWRVGLRSIDIVTTAAGNSNLANTGDQALDMLGSPGPGSIVQDVGTVPGQTYELTFATSSNNNAMKFGLMFNWDRTQVDVISTAAAGTWTPHSYTVVASSTLTRLEFIGNVVPNQSASDGALLDSVELEPVCPFVVPVANAGFEKPQQTAGVVVTRTIGSIPGWTVDAPSNNQGVDHVPASGAHTQSVNLSGTAGPGTLRQTVATKPLTTYRVSFDRSARADAQTTAMTLRWGAATIPVPGTAGAWRPFDVTVSNATGTATILELVGGTEGHVFVDNVRVLELCQ